jgi:hypothetical protein
MAIWCSALVGRPRVVRHNGALGERARFPATGAKHRHRAPAHAESICYVTREGCFRADATKPVAGRRTKTSGDTRCSRSGKLRVSHAQRLEP